SLCEAIAPSLAICSLNLLPRALYPIPRLILSPAIEFKGSSAFPNPPKAEFIPACMGEGGGGEAAGAAISSFFKDFLALDKELFLYNSSAFANTANAASFAEYILSAIVPSYTCKIALFYRLMDHFFKK